MIGNLLDPAVEVGSIATTGGTVIQLLKRIALQLNGPSPVSGTVSVQPAAGANNYAVTKSVKTPTITAGAYSAGQVIGGLQTIAGLLTTSGNGLILESITLSDKAKQSAAIDVIFFTAAPTGTFTDNAAFNPGAADLLLMGGWAQILGTSAVWSAFSANSLATLAGIGLALQLAATTLYFVLVSRGSPTYASTSDLQVTLGTLLSG